MNRHAMKHVAAKVLGGGVAAGIVAAGLIGGAPAVAAEPDTPSAALVEVDRPGTQMISAAPFDVGDYGYVEREYFASGEANQYLDEDGAVFGNTRSTLSTATVGDTAGDYLTRVVVRQPSAEKFNGTLVVEWTNVTTGQDGEFVFGESHHTLLRDGYAVAVISAQEIGVGNLVATRPARYGELDVTADCGPAVSCPRDTMSWDIFAQVTQALKNSSASPFADLDIQTVIATGQSQSAGLVSTYYNKIQPLHPVFDAIVTYDGGSVALRSDLEVPAIAIKAQISPSGPYQWTSSEYTRIWEAAGLSHGSAFVHEYMDAVYTRDGTQPGGASFTDWLMDIGHCENPNVGTKSRIGHIEGGAFAAVAAWARGGAPAAPSTLFQRDADGALVYDETGLPVGGIRIADAAVPQYTFGLNAGGWTCGAAGWWGDLSTQELEQRYVSHDEYVAQVTEVTEAALAAGYIVAGDAEETISQAQASEVAETDIAVTGSASVHQARVGSTVELSVTPELVRGAWLEQDGVKVPVTVSGTASFVKHDKRGAAIGKPRVVWRGEVSITDLTEHNAGTLTLPKHPGTLTLQWCIDAATQNARYPGHVNETCSQPATSSVSVDVVPDERIKSRVVVVARPFIASASTPVSVDVRVLSRRTSAEGAVTVTVAGRTFAAEVVDGRVSVPVGTLPRGVHRIVVDYAGSDQVRPATGRGVVVVLRR